MKTNYLNNLVNRCSSFKDKSLETIANKYSQINSQIRGEVGEIKGTIDDKLAGTSNNINYHLQEFHNDNSGYINQKMKGIIVAALILAALLSGFVYMFSLFGKDAAQ